jgi:hypothetical protein
MSSFPKVSCICPTRARFDTLRESISFFILQDYPNKELIIFNNHPVPILPHPKLAKHNIKVVNAGDYSGCPIERIYAHAMKHISPDSEYVSVWDDDDVYFPWHLSSNIEKLAKNGKSVAIRSQFGYWHDVNHSMRDDITVVSNTLEASMIAKRDAIFFNDVDRDRKDPEFTHPHTAWVTKVSREGGFLYNTEITASFRWGYGKAYAHLQSVGPHRNNEETGLNDLLRPKDVRHIFYHIVENAYLTTREGKVVIASKEEKSSLFKKFNEYDLNLFRHIDKFKVWLYWNDKNKTPLFIKHCFKSITENTFAECVILNDDSFKDYNLPPYFYNLNPVEKSEFIRVYFLCHFGGWWFDADTFVVGDLDKHYFQYLNNHETLFPSEYDVEGKITTPLLSSKPYSFLFQEAWKAINTFLTSKKPPYNLGWAQLNFVGILDVVEKWKHTLNWHFSTINGIVKWYYNNSDIDKWTFDDINRNKLQIYILHWSQIGAEVSWKINIDSDISPLFEKYPHLKKLFNESNLPYS